MRRRLLPEMVKRPSPREQALSDGVRRFSDRRGERGVECCLKRNGAYYRDLAGPSGNWGAAGPESPDSGPETFPALLDRAAAPRRPRLSRPSCHAVTHR